MEKTVLFAAAIVIFLAYFQAFPVCYCAFPYKTFGFGHTKPESYHSPQENNFAGTSEESTLAAIFRKETLEDAHNPGQEADNVGKVHRGNRNI